MTLPITRDDCVASDHRDPLAAFRSEFVLPGGVIYLDGKSLGALPRSATTVATDTIQRAWGRV